MPKVGIVTDSTCDLPPCDLEALGVSMVPLTVHFGDEHYRDWIDMRPPEFYRRLRLSEVLPTTSQPSPAEFARSYAELAEQGAEDIVVITLSAALSGTYGSAMLAAKDAPVRIRVVDSKLASQGIALVVKSVAEARDRGLDAAQLEKHAIELAASTRLYFLLDTLDYLVRGGRAGKATGLAAAVLNIKPVLEVNQDGIIEPFKKVRGRQHAVGALAAHVAEESRAKGRLRVALLHAQVQGEVEELESALAAAGADIEIVSRGTIGAVIGTYTGPGAVGITYYPIG